MLSFSPINHISVGKIEHIGDTSKTTCEATYQKVQLAYGFISMIAICV